MFRPELTTDQREFVNRWVHRLNSLYYVMNEQDKQYYPFVCQEYHIHSLELLVAGYKRQIGLKGRQVYFTTFMCVLMIDMCITNKDFTAAVHNMTDEDVTGTIEEKLHKICENSPYVLEHLADENALTKNGVKFNNGSKIMRERSGRSHTHHFNLITEAAYTADQFPMKYDELMKGMVQGSQYYIIFLETTPYGTANRFIDQCRMSVQHEVDGNLAKEDFVVNFIPWWRKLANIVSQDTIEKRPIDARMHKYFLDVEEAEDVTLTPAQKAWYVNKLQVEHADDSEDMMAEHPSTIEEALHQVGQSFVLGKEMVTAKREGRIGPIPLDIDEPAYACWDFGGGLSETAVIIVQRGKINDEFRLVYSMQNKDQPLSYFLKVLEGVPWRIRTHFLPHDAEHQNFVAVKLSGKVHTTIAQQFRENRLFNLEVIPKIHNKVAGFSVSRSFVGKVRFCNMRALDAIQALQKAQKEYDPDSDRTFDQLTKEPRLAKFNHLYDCFEIAARAWQGRRMAGIGFLENHEPAWQEQNPHKIDFLHHDGCLLA